MKVRVYWNLHKKVWSVMNLATRRVVGHFPTVVLGNVKFKVSESGRQRVLREKKKNVHAFAEGVLAPCEERLVNQAGELVSYNPYRGPRFYRKTTGEDVVGAIRVVMTTGGKVSAKGLSHAAIRAV